MTWQEKVRAVMTVIVVGEVLSVFTLLWFTDANLLPMDVSIAIQIILFTSGVFLLAWNLKIAISHYGDYIRARRVGKYGDSEWSPWMKFVNLLK